MNNTKNYIKIKKEERKWDLIRRKYSITPTNKYNDNKSNESIKYNNFINDHQIKILNGNILKLDPLLVMNVRHESVSYKLLIYSVIFIVFLFFCYYLKRLKVLEIQEQIYTI